MLKGRRRWVRGGGEWRRERGGCILFQSISEREWAKIGEVEDNQRTCECEFGEDEEIKVVERGSG